jgi:hypothetical protein
MNEWTHDELSDADLEFLNQIEESFNDSEPEGPPPEEFDAAAFGEASDAAGGVAQGESDEKSDERADRPEEGGESGESDQVNESEMDISQAETEPQQESSDKADEKDHLESGDTDSEIQEGEDDLEYDDLESQEAPSADADKDFQGDAQQELEDHLENSEQESEQEPDQPQTSDHLPDKKPQCHDHCEDTEPDEGDEVCERCQQRIEEERQQWGAIAKDMNGVDILPGDKLIVRVPFSFMHVGAVLTANVPNLEINRVAERTNGERDESKLWLSGKQISQFTGWHMVDDGPIWVFDQGAELHFLERMGTPPRDGAGQRDIEQEVEEFRQEMEEYEKQAEQPQPDPEPEPEQKEPEEPKRMRVGDMEVGDLFAVDAPGEFDISWRITKKFAHMVSHEIHWRSDGGEIDKPGTSSNDFMAYKVGHVDDEEKDEPKPPEPKETPSDEKLTKAQHNRFDNLNERITRKIQETFGSTAEKVEIVEAKHTESMATAMVQITSRGAVYSCVMSVKREKEDS